MQMIQLLFWLTHNPFQISLTCYTNLKSAQLKINQSKSEMLWLGSQCHRKDAILNLQLSCDPVYALGVHFSYDQEATVKKNFLEKLGTLKKTLNMWSQRDLSLYGKVNIVKTLALSKLIFICSVLESPENFADEVKSNYI